MNQGGFICPCCGQFEAVGDHDVATCHEAMASWLLGLAIQKAHSHEASEVNKFTKGGEHE